MYSFCNYNLTIRKFHIVICRKEMLMTKSPKRELLMKRRKQLGMSQRQVAAELGISQGYYALIEKGNRDPGFDLAISISDLFNLDVRSLKT